MHESGEIRSTKRDIDSTYNQPGETYSLWFRRFGRMRQDNSYYVDKTHFLPLLEAQPYFIFLIRPRRFGKTLWLSLLQHYYDVNKQEQFEALFGGTYIGDHPTAERNSYLVMFFNFALVNPSVQRVEASFEDNGLVEITSFLRRYQRFFTDGERQEVLNGINTEARLRRIFDYASESLNIQTGSHYRYRCKFATHVR